MDKRIPNFKKQFASDNCSGICPEAWTALKAANKGFYISYGDDEWTLRAVDLIRKFFDTDCSVYFVFNGTAGNALALSGICQSYHSVICHRESHMEVDECAAPDFFTPGLRLLPVGGLAGKLDLGAVVKAVRSGRGVHTSKPRAVSISQVTEFGAVYTAEETRALGELTHSLGLKLHVDGARFANAIAATRSEPADLTWKAGVDAITFGGTKNGFPLTEAVVFFDSSLAEDFEWRRKQGGQLASKMRYLTAPWVGMLEEGAWLKNAAHANRCAGEFAKKLSALPGIELRYPCEANAIFLKIPQKVATRLGDAGWYFYLFEEPDVYRLMTSWATSEGAIDLFIEEISRWLPC